MTDYSVWEVTINRLSNLNKKVYLMVLANLKQRNQISLEPMIVDKYIRLRLSSEGKTHLIVGSLVQRAHRILVPLLFRILKAAGFSIRSQNLEAQT